MTIRQVSDVISIYQDMGRPKASTKTYSIAAIGQMVRMGYNARARDIYYQSMKMGKGPEYYFYSGLLSIQRFILSDPNIRGVVSADLSKVDIFRLPKNDNFTNFYPIGDCGKGGTDNIEITQVAPGEENFYTGPDFIFFKFCVLKARRMDFYNLPSCVTEVDIETTFDSKKDDVDIPIDIAFDVAFQILGWEIKIKQFTHINPKDSPYQPEALELRRRLEEQANQTV